MKRKVFNPKILQLWKEVDPGNWQQLAGEITALFCETWQGQLDELRAAQREGDRLRLERIAHTLGSACGNVGAEQAHDLLRVVEHQAQALSVKDVEYNVNAITRLLDETMIQLEHLKRNNFMSLGC